MKTDWGSGGIAPRILDLGIRWRWTISFKSRPLYPQEKSRWYPLDRRLDGPQSQSGRGGEVKNSQPLPGLEPSIIQPVGPRYTTELSRLLKYPCTWFMIRFTEHFYVHFVSVVMCRFISLHRNIETWRPTGNVTLYYPDLKYIFSGKRNQIIQQSYSWEANSFPFYISLPCWKQPPIVPYPDRVELILYPHSLISLTTASITDNRKLEP
jgi:hypothetical protein